MPKHAVSFVGSILRVFAHVGNTAAFEEIS